MLQPTVNKSLALKDNKSLAPQRDKEKSKASSLREERMQKPKGGEWIGTVLETGDRPTWLRSV